MTAIPLYWFQLIDQNNSPFLTLTLKDIKKDADSQGKLEPGLIAYFDQEKNNNQSKTFLAFLLDYFLINYKEKKNAPGTGSTARIEFKIKRLFNFLVDRHPGVALDFSSELAKYPALGGFVRVACAKIPNAIAVDKQTDEIVPDVIATLDLTRKLSNQENPFGIVQFFTQFFQEPLKFAACILWLLDRKIIPKEIVKTGILHNFLDANYFGLDTDNNPLQVFYQRLSKQQQAKELLEYIANIVHEISNIKGYKRLLNGEQPAQPDKLIEVSCEFPVIDISSNKQNFAALNQLFETKFLFCALIQIIEKEDETLSILLANFINNQLGLNDLKQLLELAALYDLNQADPEKYLCRWLGKNVNAVNFDKYIAEKKLLPMLGVLAPYNNAVIEKIGDLSKLKEFFSDENYLTLNTIPLISAQLVGFFRSYTKNKKSANAEYFFNSILSFTFVRSTGYALDMLSDEETIPYHDLLQCLINEFSNCFMGKLEQFITEEFSADSYAGLNDLYIELRRNIGFIEKDINKINKVIPGNKYIFQAFVVESAYLKLIDKKISLEHFLMHIMEISYFEKGNEGISECERMLVELLWQTTHENLIDYILIFLEEKLQLDVAKIAFRKYGNLTFLELLIISEKLNFNLLNKLHEKLFFVNKVLFCVLIRLIKRGGENLLMQLANSVNDQPDLNELLKLAVIYKPDNNEIDYAERPFLRWLSKNISAISFDKHAAEKELLPLLGLLAPYNNIIIEKIVDLIELKEIFSDVSKLAAGDIALVSAQLVGFFTAYAKSQKTEAAEYFFNHIIEFTLACGNKLALRMLNNIGVAPYLKIYADNFFDLLFVEMKQFLEDDFPKCDYLNFKSKYGESIERINLLAAFNEPDEFKIRKQAFQAFVVEAVYPRLVDKEVSFKHFIIDIIYYKNEKWKLNFKSKLLSFLLYTNHQGLVDDILLFLEVGFELDFEKIVFTKYGKQSFLHLMFSGEVKPYLLDKIYEKGLFGIIVSNYSVKEYLKYDNKNDAYKVIKSLLREYKKRPGTYLLYTDKLIELLIQFYEKYYITAETAESFRDIFEEAKNILLNNVLRIVKNNSIVAKGVQLLEELERDGKTVVNNAAILKDCVLSQEPAFKSVILDAIGYGKWNFICTVSRIAPISQLVRDCFNSNHVKVLEKYLDYFDYLKLQTEEKLSQSVMTVALGILTSKSSTLDWTMVLLKEKPLSQFGSKLLQTDSLNKILCLAVSEEKTNFIGFAISRPDIFKFAFADVESFLQSKLSVEDEQWTLIFDELIINAIKEQYEFITDFVSNKAMADKCAEKNITDACKEAINSNNLLALEKFSELLIKRNEQEPKIFYTILEHAIQYGNLKAIQLICAILANKYPAFEANQQQIYNNLQSSISDEKFGVEKVKYFCHLSGPVSLSPMAINSALKYAESHKSKFFSPPIYNVLCNTKERAKYEKICEKSNEPREQIIALLEDYTKKSAIGRFLAGAWNRHHIKEIDKIIKEARLPGSVMDAAAILEQVKAIHLKNPIGSLARCIQYIDDHVKIENASTSNRAGLA